MTQFFNLGLSSTFMTLNVNNSEKNIFKNFYITLKINQDLNQNSETYIPQEYYRAHPLEI